MHVMDFSARLHFSIQTYLNICTPKKNKLFSCLPLCVSWKIIPMKTNQLSAGFFFVHWDFHTLHVIFHCFEHYTHYSIPLISKLYAWLDDCDSCPHSHGACGSSGSTEVLLFTFVSQYKHLALIEFANNNTELCSRRSPPVLAMGCSWIVYIVFVYNLPDWLCFLLPSDSFLAMISAVYLMLLKRQMRAETTIMRLKLW